MNYRPLLRETLFAGLGAGLLSALAVAQGSRANGHRAVAGLNAPSHWLWGDDALRAETPSVRHTVVGVATHQASAFFWAGLYAVMRALHRRPTPVNAVTDAVTVMGAAIVVDLALVPKRLTPGFEHHLTSRRLGVVYIALALGLIAGAMVTERE